MDNARVCVSIRPPLSCCLLSLCAQVQIIRSKSDPNYKPPYTTVSACVRATLRENGFKGPFQGLGATILRNTPANAVYLGTFEVLKGQAAQRLGCKVMATSGGSCL